MAADKPYAFISYSSSDRARVQEIVEALKSAEVDLFYDIQEIQPGDSIPQKITDGLEKADYFIPMLSRAYAESKWGQQELDSAVMRSLSERGVRIVPVRLDEVAVPALLQSISYVDVSQSIEAGLPKLIGLFKRETSSPVIATPSVDPCVRRLSQFSRGDLRRLIQKLKRPQVRAIWNSALGGDMDDEVGKKDLLDCTLDLIDRAEREGKLPEVYQELCTDHPNLANPR